MAVAGACLFASKQWLVMRGQLQEMKAQSSSAKEAAYAASASLRPWIKITDVQTRGDKPPIPALSFQTSPSWPIKTSQATLQLKISMKNIGHSPTKLTVNVELFLPLWRDGYANVIYQEKKRFCGEFAKKGLNVDQSLQITLFPDEAHEWYAGVAAMVDSKVINYFSDRPPTPYILPVVAVCVNYRSGDSQFTYQTSALYEVFGRKDRTRFFEVGNNTPAKQIFLIRNEASDDAN